MNFIKRVSALLAAVMLFSFVGFVNTNEVQAATTSVTIKTGTLKNNLHYNGYHEYYVAGKATCIEFEITGLDEGQYYDVTAVWNSNYEARYYIPENENIINRTGTLTMLAKQGVTKFCFNSNVIKPEYYEGGYLKSGYYTITVGSISVMVCISANADDGYYTRTYYGSLEAKPGNPFTYTSSDGSYEMLKIGITNQLTGTFTDLGPAFTSSGHLGFKVLFCPLDSNPATGFESTVYSNGVRTGYTLKTSSLSGSARNFVDINGNFIPGYYKIVCSDGVFGTEIASKTIKVTGDVEDGFYPSNNPAVPQLDHTVWYNVSAPDQKTYTDTKSIELELFFINGMNPSNLTWKCEYNNSVIANGTGKDALVKVENLRNYTPINGHFRNGDYKITFYYYGSELYTDTCSVVHQPTPTPTNTNTPTPTRKPTSTPTSTPTPTRRPTSTPTSTPTPTRRPTSTPTPTATSTPTPVAPGIVSATWKYGVTGNSDYPNGNLYINTDVINLVAVANIDSEYFYECSFDGDVIASGIGLDAYVDTSSVYSRYLNSDRNFIEGTYTIRFYNNYGELIYSDSCKVEVGSNNPTVTPVPGESGLGGFVERCYTCCLGRDSEPAGKAYWIHCLEGAYTGCDVAKEFFFCDELINQGISNEEFVARLYSTFMDRTPDQGGFDFWVSCLNNGSSRLDIFYGFVNSPEWRDICAMYGIRSGGVVMPVGVSISASQQAIAFVGRLYATGLGRDPEADGLKMWAEALDNGSATGSSVASNFFLGSEFENLNVSNQEFLIRVYRIFMDRPIDIENDAGFLYWLGQLDSGALTRADIVNTFADSDEFRSICAGAGFNA